MRYSFAYTHIASRRITWAICRRIGVELSQLCHKTSSFSTLAHLALCKSCDFEPPFAPIDLSTRQHTQSTPSYVRARLHAHRSTRSLVAHSDRVRFASIVQDSLRSTSPITCRVYTPLPFGFVAARHVLQPALYWLSWTLGFLAQLVAEIVAQCTEALIHSPSSLFDPEPLCCRIATSL